MTYARTPKPVTETPLQESTLHGWRRRLHAFCLWLAGKIQGHPVWPYPLEHFYALEDRPGRVYVWTLNADLTTEEAAEIASEFHSRFVRRYNREPRALHIMHPDVDFIKRLTREDVDQITPYLKE